MNELVERLSKPGQPVAAERAETVQGLKEQIDRKFVLIKFTGTKGGTELGYKLDESRSNIEAGDFEAGTGKVSLVGELTLNYVRVRCIAEIDLATLKGTGYLEPLNDQAA